MKGLDSCRYVSASTIDHRTLAKSGRLPLSFLQGCGLSDFEIEVAKLYQPDLTNSQITDIIYRISDIRLSGLIQFYSCFISYSSADHAFAERLYADLQNKGVRCWFAPEDIKIGDPVRRTIDTAIRLRDKLVLILSETSIVSDWVEHEVQQALEEEEKRGALGRWGCGLLGCVLPIRTQPA